jgi:PKD repeat protein
MAKVIGPCISDTINTPRDFIFAIEKFIGLQSDIYKQEDQSHSLFSKISYIRSRWGRVNANFLASKRSGTAPLTVQFKDISTGSPIGWKWDFGDGIVSFEKDPIHTYEKPGTYDVSLVAHAGSNSSILKSQYIYAFTEDVINNVVFYVKQIVDGKETNSLTGKRGAQFKFVCQSDGPIVSRFWDFGDGSQPVYTDDPTKIEIQYTYNYTGKFYPVLTVSDSGKTCKKQLEHPIIITKN